MAEGYPDLICPVCGGQAVMRCRCWLADSKCAAGHQWYYKDGQRVLGPSDHSKMTKMAVDPLTTAGLGAIGGASGWMASMALQKGMNVAKRIIWKHMSPAQKAKYLLKKVFGPRGMA